MLENLAAQFFFLSGFDQWAGRAVVLCLGGLVAVWTWPERGEMTRIPYLACLGLIALFVAAALTVWLASLRAMVYGALWMPLAFETVAMLVAGYALAVTSAARARDAFDAALFGVMGFLPVINLVLVLRRSEPRADTGPRPPVPALNGRAGLAVAVVSMLGAAGLFAFTAQRSEALEAEIADYPAAMALRMTYTIKGLGLPVVLARFASGIETTRRIDASTTLDAVEVMANGIRYRYTVADPARTASDLEALGILKTGCASPVLGPILDAGGRLEHVFARADGTPLATIAVSRETCSGKKEN